MTTEDIVAHWRNTPRIKKIWFAIRRQVLAITDLPHHIRRVRWFVQRGKRGWADCDWWNMDRYLSTIILPMLKQLKENQHGYPGYGQASTPEKWDAILDKMIEGFEAANRVIEDDYYKEISGDSIEAITHAPREEMLKWGEASKRDQKVFSENMKLFNKWFFALWD